MDGYLGTIMMCALNFAPQNWIGCEGQLMPVMQNQALYSLMGIAFGGDGRTNFGIPDLRGRVPVGLGAGPNLTPRNIGQFYGIEQTSLTLNQNQMPIHAHSLSEKQAGKSFSVSSTASLYCNKTQPDVKNPGNAFCAPVKSGMSAFDAFASTQDATMNSAAVSVNTTGTVDVSNLQIGPAGGTQPISMPVIQPSLVLRFILCTNGLYPSRP
jgi:microcystin-dependent protein